MAVKIQSVEKGANSSGAHWYGITVYNDGNSSAYFGLKQGSLWQTLYGSNNGANPASPSYPNGAMYVAAYNRQTVWIKLETDNKTYQLYVYYGSDLKKLGSTGDWGTSGGYTTIQTDGGDNTPTYTLSPVESLITNTTIAVQVTGGSSGDSWNFYWSDKLDKTAANTYDGTATQTGTYITYTYNKKFSSGTTYYFIAKNNSTQINSNGNTKYPISTLAQSTYYCIFDKNCTDTVSDMPDNISANSSNTYYTFNLSNYTLKTPTRSGYNFKGWGTSSTSSSATTSFTAYKSTYYEVTAYAIWEKILMSLSPNITKLTISNVSSSEFTVSATQNNLVAGSWGIQISTSSTFSNNVITSTQELYSTSTCTYTFSGLSPNTLYYIRTFNVYFASYEYTSGWSKKTNITLFYWVSSTNDGDYITQKQPTTNITAKKWDALQAKISEVSVRLGKGTVYYDKIGSLTSPKMIAEGGNGQDYGFNNVRKKLKNLGCTGLPNEVSSGDPVLASYFMDFKTAINNAITAANQN